MTDSRVRLYDTARAIRNRARSRALERLKAAHLAEFQRYESEEREIARNEIAAIEAAGAVRSTTAHHAEPPRDPQANRIRTPADDVVPQPAAPAVLLQHGPRSDKPITARVRADVGACPHCAGFHDRGHRCAICGTAPEFGKAKPYKYRGGAA